MNGSCIRLNVVVQCGLHDAIQCCPTLLETTSLEARREMILKPHPRHTQLVAGISH